MNVLVVDNTGDIVAIEKEKHSHNFKERCIKLTGFFLAMQR